MIRRDIRDIFILSRSVPLSRSPCKWGFLPGHSGHIPLGMSRMSRLSLPIGAGHFSLSRQEYHMNPIHALFILATIASGCLILRGIELLYGSGYPSNHDQHPRSHNHHDQGAALHDRTLRGHHHREAFTFMSNQKNGSITMTLLILFAYLTSWLIVPVLSITALVLFVRWVIGA